MPDDAMSHTFFRRSPPNGARTINDDARTVEAVLSTGAIVQRNDWDGVYNEELVISEDAIDLSRFQDAPLFLDHRHRDSNSMIGRVERAWIAGGNLMGLLRFSAEEPGAAAFRKVQEGTFKAVSVGYRVDKRETKHRDGSVPLIRAIRWTPFEASLVGLGADSGARVRSAAEAGQGGDDDDDWQEPAIVTPAKRMPERKRREYIETSCRALNLPAEFCADLIGRGAQFEEARDAIMTELAVRSAVGGEVLTHTRRSMDENPDLSERSAIVDAMANRLYPSLPLSDHARQFRGLSPMRLMEQRLEACGEHTRRLSRDEIIERAYGKSDFPALLTESGNRALLAAYEAAPAALKAAARQRPGNAPDFRPLASLRLGEHPKLLRVNDGGEVTHGTIGESKQSYSIATFARIFALTRQALINDDLGAFSDFLLKSAAAAAELEAEQLAALLTANSGNGVTMEDNKALFHTDHANKAGSGAAPDVTTLGAARQAMREQKGLDGVTPINAVPKFIQVGAAKETVAEQLLATLYPAQTSNVNPFSGKMQLLVEPRLTGNAWRLFADPATMPILEYAYLADAPGPQLLIQEGFEVMGTKWRVSLDFGCGVIDHRGAYLNPGA